MDYNWNDIKWIFEYDDIVLRDIYISKTTIQDWEKLFNFLNENFKISYRNSLTEEEHNSIMVSDALNYLRSENQKAGESIYISFSVQHILINCNLFAIDQIEFNVNSKEIISYSDFKNLFSWMNSLSNLLQNSVILTGENQQNFPLIKVDYSKKELIILTEVEAKKNWSNN